MQSLDSLVGGSTLREQASLQSAILNALLSGKHPQTFCAASSSQLETFKPWEKASTLNQVGHSKYDFDDSEYISSEEIMAIIFQLVWTLAVLQKEFPGYQHNSIASSVRLFKYGAARCYKVGQTAYYIPNFMPLPVIVDWRTSNCSQKGLDVPYRSETEMPGKDLNDILSAILSSINTNLPPKEFRLARDMQQECTRYHIKIRRRDGEPMELQLKDQNELYLDKRETGENICIPFILGLQCPPGFSSLYSPSGETALCGRCPERIGKNEAPTIIRQNDTLVCSNGEQLEKTNEDYSFYFNDFLYPIQVREQALAVVKNF
jgi:hypothetical protein